MASFELKRLGGNGAEGDGKVYLIADLICDMLIRDLRSTSLVEKGRVVRPYFIGCVDTRSRSMMAYRFLYGPPNEDDVAYVIRAALLHEKTSEGMSAKIRIQNRKFYRSALLQELVMESGVALEYDAPHSPENKGVIERVFQTFNTHFFSTLPGYLKSSAKESNLPKAELTLAELELLFREFLDKYESFS